MCLGHLQSVATHFPLLTIFAAELQETRLRMLLPDDVETLEELTLVDSARLAHQPGTSSAWVRQSAQRARAHLHLQQLA